MSAWVCTWRVHDGLPDMELMLDEHRRSSWQPGTEIALGDLYIDNAPFSLCPRGTLKRAIAAWTELGYTPMVGLETEAYVFQRDQDGVWRPYDTPGAFVYGTGPANDPQGVMDDIWEAAHQASIPLESTNGEFDNGQFELTLCFDEALKACDDAFLLKTMAREIGLKKGLLITFMPKPIPDRGGSGLHVNFSFADKQGHNSIAPTNELSALAKHCMAGLIEHHEALAGLLAVTVNSYDRLSAGSLAGYWANWAEDHRLVTTRCSTSSAKSARLEHRMADCATNPYQAVASVLQAARLGYENKLPLQPAEDMDGLNNVREKRHIPSGLDKSLNALDKNLELRTAELILRRIPQPVAQDVCQDINSGDHIRFVNVQGRKPKTHDVWRTKITDHVSINQRLNSSVAVFKGKGHLTTSRCTLSRAYQRQLRTRLLYPVYK